MGRKKRRAFAVVALLLAALLLAGYIVINNGLRDSVLMVGESFLKNKALGIMNTAIREVLTESGDISDLLIVEKDGSGKITMVSVDTTLINRISNQCAILVRDELAELSEARIEVPLGNVLSSKLFAGLGPKFKLRVVPMGSATASFYSEFETAGINQTRYKVYVVLEAHMKLVFGTSTLTAQVKSEVLVCEAIIVGDVPDTYANMKENDDFLNLLP